MACKPDEHDWEDRKTPGGKPYKKCTICGKVQT
jgi:hypothetical protein